ncbi:poly(A) polymerase [Endozoicomonas sp. (ex Bugula neritina AB1)]|nr:poly(A) polymerase [Endozoicomonas sp. (ex Bugula neritina AB1)]
MFWLIYNKKRRKPNIPAVPQPSKQVIPRDSHPVSRKKISANALKVVNRLNSQGYEAYLVGGCVRDLYLDLNPKDFDIVTSATPEDVRHLFRNSRLIGRRFKLVHVLFGREMIEVATFRASHEIQHGSDKSRHSESGRILRDNVYGSIEDDAIRRDFTINALYYDARDFSVIDFCNGVEDIKNRTLRLIGDPVTRYHEDPVRMLRAIRFAAKLDFDIAPESDQPIRELGHLLKDIPSARLFDEVLKLLQSGQGVETFHLLREYGLFKALFPASEHCLIEGDEIAEHLILQSLRSTDKRIAKNRPVTPAFLFAALLWAPMRKLTREFQKEGMPPVPALQQAAMTVLDNQVAHTAIPKRFSIMVREIWDFQGRLERRQPRAIESLLEHPRFRAAYDFLVLREQAGEKLGGVGQWWTEIQETDEEGRLSFIRDLRNPQQPRKSGETKKTVSHPAKRRRRRRKPQGKSGGVES